MNPEFAQRFLKRVSNLKPDRQTVVAFGTSILIAAFLQIKDRWDARPVTCLQRGEFGTSIINLSNRRILANGVQNIQLLPNFLEENREVDIAINHSDPKCTRTETHIKFLRDKQQLDVYVHLYFRDSSLASYWSTKLGFTETTPEGKVALSLIWSDWKPSAAAINGRLVEGLKFTVPEQ